MLGLFVRRCRIEYASAPFEKLADIQGAYDQYLHQKSGDSEFLDGNRSIEDGNASGGWLSEYNIREFLVSQAERIERKVPCIYYFSYEQCAKSF